MSLLNCCKCKREQTPQLESEESAALEIAASNNDGKIIYFHLVRHGETDYNKQGKVQGHMEIPLNQNGFNQAESLGLCLTKHLKNTNAVIASPVLRGKQTGEEIYKQFNQNAKLELM